MTIGLSSWCWSKSENETLHTACIGLWALAGLLLTVSQLVFIVLGVKAKGSGTRLAVLTVALILLGLIGLFVFAPSEHAFLTLIKFSDSSTRVTR